LSLRESEAAVLAAAFLRAALERLRLPAAALLVVSVA
jgi:hypothetical protein